jgi:Transcriptional repressor
MQKRKRFREEGAVVDDGTVEDKRKRHVETMGEENVEGSGTTNGTVQETKNDAAMEGKVDEERRCCPVPSTLNSIASLVVGYGSSSDEEEDGKNHNVEWTDTVTTALHDKTESATISPNAVCNTTNSTTDDQVNNIASKYKTKQCRYFLRNGTCKNGDSCTYIHDMEQHKSYKKNADARKERQSQKDRARNQAKKEMNLLTSGRKDGGGSSSLGSGVGGQTLLRKLLENDIRRERSLCLQLLRYIVDCNYLQERRDVKEEQEHDL